jgi:hypothetical protein
VNNADSQPSARKPGSRHWLGALAIAVTVALFAWMFFAGIFVGDDISCEAIDKPLAVGHVMKAREEGVPLHEYMRNDPVWADMKSGDPDGSYAYVGKRFQFEFFACQAPLLGFCYAPFVKLAGVSAAAAILYSTFFAAMAVLLMAWLAWKAFDGWHALAAVLCVTSSLIWLIHIKAAYAAWMPSACLICGMACCLYVYALTGRRWALAVAAACLGLLYLAGWLSHVAGFFLLALALLSLRRRTWKIMLADGYFAAAVTVAAILAVSGAYAAWAGCSFREIHATMFEDMFNRFSLGGVPMLEKLTFPEKLGYAFRCMFLDSTTADHLDKCLEGRPAIPALFSFFIVIGAFYAIKNRSVADKLVMLWLVAVFALLGAAMTYTHRYALLALPAMALLAARGVAGLGNDLGRLVPAAVNGYGLLVGAAFCVTVCATHHDYFETYLRHKRPDFEIDRQRDRGVLARWIQARYSPQDTLVVYGDPIMFARNFHMFYFFDQPFRFKYWSNHFNSRSTAEEIKAWEQEQLSRFQRLVFVFSPVLMGDPQTQQFKNDFRPFLAAHGNPQPVFTHAYDGRPLFFAFEISREARR